jgi:hypothetical protein
VVIGRFFVPPSLLLSFVALLGGLLVGTNAFAEANKCDSLLKDGVRDYHGQNVDLFSYEKIKHWLSNSEATTRAAAEAGAEKLGIKVSDIFDLNFGASNATNNFQSWKRDFINSDYYEFAGKAESRDVVKAVSAKLVDAYVTCVRGITGTQVWIDASSDKDFAVFFLFKPPEDFKQSYVEITGFTVSNARCPHLKDFAPPRRGPNFKLGPTQNFQCVKMNINEASAVWLSTGQFEPQIQPKFDVFSSPKTGAVTISGIISAQATRVTSHTITYSFSGTPSPSDFQRNKASAPIFDWTSNDVREIDKFDFLDKGVGISPGNPSDFGQCKLVSADVKMDDKHRLITTARSSCAFNDFGGDYNKALVWLKNGNYTYTSTAILIQRMPVTAEAKQIFEPNSRKSSWRFIYDLPKDDGLPWVYTFDFHIIDPTGNFNLFRRSDGNQQLTSGPFQAVLGEDHSVTVFRANPGG